jgi:hypothetical protein
VLLIVKSFAMLFRWTDVRPTNFFISDNLVCRTSPWSNYLSVSRIFYLLSRMKKYTRSFVERKGTALTQTQTKTPKTMAESRWRRSCDVFQNCTIKDDLFLFGIYDLSIPFSSQNWLSNDTARWRQRWTTRHEWWWERKDDTDNAVTHK